MTDHEDFAVSSCHDLYLGDEIEATYKGVIVHRGRVTDLARDHNLFWIMDELRGGRRLLDCPNWKSPASGTSPETRPPTKPPDYFGCPIFRDHNSEPLMSVMPHGHKGGLSRQFTELSRKKD